MRSIGSLVALALIGAVPTFDAAPAFAGDQVRTMCVTGVSRGDRLNIREYGYASARRIGSIPAGGCATVIGVCDGWCNVEYRGVNGMAAARFLAPARSGGPDGAGHGPDSYCVDGVARGDVLNVRSGPGARSGRVGALPPDACGITVSGSCQGSWCPVRWRGVAGWVNRRYLAE